MATSATSTNDSGNYTSFAVAGGSGEFGTLVVSALLAQGANVVVLSRNLSQSIPEGASLRTVNYETEETLTNALNGIEVVISLLWQDGFAKQPTLAIAAKKAGVKLFVPSEFGAVTERFPKDGVLGFKLALHEQLRSLDLPYTLFYNGVFTDWAFSPPMGFDIPNGKITIIGEGKTPLTWTTRPDIARFVAYTLTRLPPTSLHNATLRVEGDKASFVEVAREMEKVFDKPFEVIVRPAAEVEEDAKAGGHKAWIAQVGSGMDKGWADVGVADNTLVPGFKPETVTEALRKYYV